MRLEIWIVVPHGPREKVITSVGVALLGKVKVSLV